VLFVLVITNDGSISNTRVVEHPANNNATAIVDFRI
tara:strand:+ start:846 stop:953 length:108 start_codon:yes stop_codon:yes gene_type:complete